MQNRHTPLQPRKSSQTLRSPTPFQNPYRTKLSNSPSNTKPSNQTPKSPPTHPPGTKTNLSKQNKKQPGSPRPKKGVNPRRPTAPLSSALPREIPPSSPGQAQSTDRQTGPFRRPSRMSRPAVHCGALDAAHVHAIHPALLCISRTRGVCTGSRIEAERGLSGKPSPFQKTAQGLGKGRRGRGRRVSHLQTMP